MGQATREQRAASLLEIESRLALFGVTRAITQIGQMLDTVEQFVLTGERAEGSLKLETGQCIEYQLRNEPDPREPHKSNSRVVIKKK
jgi:hypothetical protein